MRIAHNINNVNNHFWSISLVFIHNTLYICLNIIFIAQSKRFIEEISCLQAFCNEFIFLAFCFDYYFRWRIFLHFFFGFIIVSGTAILDYLPTFAFFALVIFITDVANCMFLTTFSFDSFECVILFIFMTESIYLSEYPSEFQL